MNKDINSKVFLIVISCIFGPKQDKELVSENLQDNRITLNNSPNNIKSFSTKITQVLSPFNL